MSILKSAARGVLRPLLNAFDFDLRLARERLVPLGARHAELSAILSLIDSPGNPSSWLLDLVPPLISRASGIKLSLLAGRNAPDYVHVWPGEHYRLLAALIQELRPREVLEIGTYTGLSALTMVSVLPEDSRLTTVDVIPWNKIPGTFLNILDFADTRLRQLVCNFADLAVCKAHGRLLQKADLIFVDGPKDGVFEGQLLENFAHIGLKQDILLVFDDIRVWNMLSIWRRIRQAKLDVTSFGHFSGTGLVQWCGV